MKLAVIMAKDMPTNHQGLPDEWPVQCVELKDGRQPVNARAVVMDHEELEALKERLRAKRESWKEKSDRWNEQLEAMWEKRHEAKRAWAASGWKDEKLKAAYEKLHAAAEAEALKYADKMLDPKQIAK